MTPSEFEEKSYEAPLYNQLERGNTDIFTPGQVLESTLGFDRGLFLSQAAFWGTLGYKTPLGGAALAYYNWPYTRVAHAFRSMERMRQFGAGGCTGRLWGKCVGFNPCIAFGGELNLSERIHA